MKRFYILFIVPFLFTCAKKQPEAAWLIIEPWQLEENPQAQHNQGEMTQAITEAFVNMDGKMLGAFTLPAKIPVIGDGSHDFVILAGIKNNGITASKRRYPFLERYEVTMDIIKNDTVKMYPKTRYYKELRFHIEDFEDPINLNLEHSDQSTAFIQPANDPEVLKWGNYFGKVVLTDADSLWSCITTFDEVFPKLGAEVYLELDFYNTNSVLTSVLSFGNGFYYNDPYIQLNPQEKPVWKHIYIDLKEIVSSRDEAPFNEVGLTSILDELGTQKYVYLDNIKVIHL